MNVERGLVFWESNKFRSTEIVVRSVSMVVYDETQENSDAPCHIQFCVAV